MEYSVAIPATSSEDGKLSSHTVYTVEIRKENETFYQKWVVNRRYNEFLVLHNTLSQNFELEDIQFPPKKLFGNNDPDFIKDRREKLEEYLRKILAIPEIACDPNVKKFLLFPTIAEDDKDSDEDQNDMENLVDSFEIVRQAAMEDATPHETDEKQIKETTSSSGQFTERNSAKIEKVRALYDYEAQLPTDLSFKAGEVIIVTKSEGDWWKGCCDGHIGDFPSTYVTVDVMKEDPFYSIEVVKDCAEAVAMYDHSGDIAYILNFKFGDIIKLYRIEEHEESGWWLGSINGGTIGYFSKHFVRKLSESDYFHDEKSNKKLHKMDITNYSFDINAKQYIRNREETNNSLCL